MPIELEFLGTGAKLLLGKHGVFIEWWQQVQSIHRRPEVPLFLEVKWRITIPRIIRSLISIEGIAIGVLPMAILIETVREITGAANGDE
jgi:hypothetical protein